VNKLADILGQSALLLLPVVVVLLVLAALFLMPVVRRLTAYLP
jgi:uncharacterized membrane protein YqhA